MDLLVSTALTITLSPGSVSTMSEALRAASVASSTAMPMSAFFNAGASLTPSPVMPQMWPRSWRRLTISYLCSGNTPANPSAFSMSSSMGMPFTVPFLSPRRVVEGYMLTPAGLLADGELVAGDHLDVDAEVESSPDGLGAVVSRWVEQRQEADELPRVAGALLVFFRHLLVRDAERPEATVGLMMSSETIPTKSCQSGGFPPPLARTMAMMAAISMTHDSGFHMKPRNLSSLLSFFSSSLLGPNALSRPSPSALVRPLRSHFSVLNTSSTGILDWVGGWVRRRLGGGDGGLRGGRREGGGACTASAPLSPWMDEDGVARGVGEGVL
nr:unnamed protein product [Digitaria exilis]